jgi:LysM repeat protein
MKPSLLLALFCTLFCSSCQSFHWPWQKAAVNPDPYAASTGVPGQYQAYPGAAVPGANQNYAYPNYSTAGEQAQVTPANGAQPNYAAGQQDWSAGGNTAATKKSTALKPSPKTTTSVAKSAVKGGGTYTVKHGDTLSSISRVNGTTVSKLMQINGLKNTTIRDGQTLRVR